MKERNHPKICNNEKLKPKNRNQNLSLNPINSDYYLIYIMPILAVLGFPSFLQSGKNLLRRKGTHLPSSPSYSLDVNCNNNRYSEAH